MELEKTLMEISTKDTSKIKNHMDLGLLQLKMKNGKESIKMVNLMEEVK